LVAAGFQLALLLITVPPLWATLRFLMATTAWAGPAGGRPGAVAPQVMSLSSLAAWLAPAAMLVLVFATVAATRLLMLAGIVGLAMRATRLRRYQEESLRIL